MCKGNDRGTQVQLKKENRNVIRFLLSVTYFPHRNLPPSDGNLRWRNESAARLKADG